ncbi:peptidoglycan DD-metalloendopeptidase family protein [Haliangium sp.]|uniref:peptidoglycan DD-metalloendopeptidase family protein n=1 Tax=Haliangium sp. TaxID=2663208 RepID=UPI003D09D0BC
MAAAVAAVAMVAVAAATPGRDPGPTAGEVSAAFEAQLDVIERTDELLAAKYEQQAHTLNRRMRAAYKLMRADWSAPGLVLASSEQRAALAQRRALAKRALARTATELELLRAEVGSAARARRYVEGARDAVAEPTGPAPGTLASPVDPGVIEHGVGVYRHRTGVRLTRRGVELSATPGAPVRPVAAGVVRYAGRARSLGAVIVIDHGGYCSVLARLAAVSVAVGAAVGPQDEIGRAEDARVYLEIRLNTGSGGYPVDPGPLLESSHQP